MVRIKKIVLATLIIFSLTGCSLMPDGTIVQDNENTNQTITENTTIANNKYEGQLSSNLIADAEYNNIEKNDWKEMTAYKRKVTKEIADKYSTIFSFNNSVTNLEEIDWGNKGTNYNYTFSDGSTLMANCTYIKYESNRQKAREYKHIFGGNEGSKGHYYKEELPKKELDSMSYDEAKKVALTYVSKCNNDGYKISTNEIRYFAMDYEHVNKILEQGVNYNKLGEKTEIEKWTKEDEVYYFEFPMMMDNTNIYRYGFGSETIDSPEVVASVVVGKRGLEFFNVNNYVYANEGTIISDKLIDLDEVINIVNNSLQYSENVFTIENISKEYVITRDITKKKEEFANDYYTVKPCWVLTLSRDVNNDKPGQQEKNIASKKYYKYLIDAKTGALTVGQA